MPEKVMKDGRKIKCLKPSWFSSSDLYTFCVKMYLFSILTVKRLLVIILLIFYCLLCVFFYKILSDESCSLVVLVIGGASPMNESDFLMTSLPLV